MATKMTTRLSIPIMREANEVTVPSVGGRLWVGMAPGKKIADHDRDLDEDLRAMKSDGVDTIVSILTPGEIEGFHLSDYYRRAIRFGMVVIPIPWWPDMDIPIVDVSVIEATVTSIVSLLHIGRRVYIHCRGGHGRSGTLVACLLTSIGFLPESAILKVRVERHQNCVRTQAQERLVYDYAHVEPPASLLRPTPIWNWYDELKEES